MKELHYYQSPTLLVVDERCYPSFGREGSDFVFLAITARHQNRSRILTTNPQSADRGMIFDSTTASTAIADRLVQRSEIFILEGTSYRGKQK